MLAAKNAQTSAGCPLGGGCHLAFISAHPGGGGGLWCGAAAAGERGGLPDGGGGAEPRLGKHRSARGLANAGRGMLTQHDSALIGSLPRIAAPTLVLVGSEDRNFLGAADYMAAKIQ